MANENKDKNKKILVIEAIEDDSALRTVLRDKFTSEGFSFLEAGDGEEGIAIALREHPNLIVLDILMPKMDGITMMEKLRKTSEWGKSVPIVILTNLSADSERINKAITENEPAYYLVKSNYTISDLVEKIKERLSRQ